MEGTELMKDFSDIRIFLCTTPIRINYSFDGLMGRAQSIFDQDPTSGHLFLFFNRNRDRVKILFWDQDGFCIWYKRLERGTFQFPSTAASVCSSICWRYWLAAVSDKRHLRSSVRIVPQLSVANR
jgi:transposase